MSDSDPFCGLSCASFSNSTDELRCVLLTDSLSLHESQTVVSRDAVWRLMPWPRHSLTVGGCTRVCACPMGLVLAVLAGMLWRSADTLALVGRGEMEHERDGDTTEGRDGEPAQDETAGAASPSRVVWLLLPRRPCLSYAW